MYKCVAQDFQKFSLIKFALKISYAQTYSHYQVVNRLRNLERRSSKIFLCSDFLYLYHTFDLLFKLFLPEFGKPRFLWYFLFEKSDIPRNINILRKQTDTESQTFFFGVYIFQNPAMPKNVQYLNNLHGKESSVLLPLLFRLKLYDFRRLSIRKVIKAGALPRAIISMIIKHILIALFSSIHSQD